MAFLLFFSVNNSKFLGVLFFSLVECIITLVLSISELKSNFLFFIISLITRSGLPILILLGVSIQKTFYYSHHSKTAINYVFWGFSIFGLCVSTCELAYFFNEHVEIFSFYDSFLHSFSFLLVSIQFVKHRTFALVTGLGFCVFYHSVRSIQAEMLIQDIFNKFLSFIVFLVALGCWSLGNKNSRENVRKKEMGKITMKTQKKKKRVRESVKIEELPDACFVVNLQTKTIYKKNMAASSFFSEHSLQESNILETLKINVSSNNFEAVVKKNALQRSSISYQLDLSKGDLNDSAAPKAKKNLLENILEKLQINSRTFPKKWETGLPSTIEFIEEPKGTYKCLCIAELEEEYEDGISSRTNPPENNETKIVYSVRFFEIQKGFAVCFIQEDECNLRERIMKNASKIMRQVCHDIRNPASSIELFCKMAKEDPTTPQEFRKKYLSTMKTSAMIIQILAEDLLDVFLMEHGSFKLRTQKMFLRKVLNQAKKIIEVQLGQRKVSVSFELGKDVPPFIFTDKDRFFQIVLNLLSNARKFTLEGEIKIKVEKEKDIDHVYRVSVSDTGTGMSPEFLKVIGNEGVREENAASSALNPKGIGLGLNLCQKLACLIGPNDPSLAKLSVTSVLGQGSTFSFTVLSQQLKRSFSRTKSCVQSAQFEKKNKLKNFEGQSTHKQIPRNESIEWTPKIGFTAGNLRENSRGFDEKARGLFGKISIDKESKRISGAFSQRVIPKQEHTSRESIQFLVPIDPTKSLNQNQLSSRNNNVSASLDPDQSQDVQAPYVFSKHTGFNKLKAKKPDRRSSVNGVLREISTKRKANVLVADDEFINVIILEKQLQKLVPDGFNFIRAENGKQALEAFEESLKKYSDADLNDANIQMVFLDNFMPLMNGMDVANAILEICSCQGHDPPTLVLTTADKELQGVQMFDFFLSKPIKKEELEGLLHELEYTH